MGLTMSYRYPVDCRESSPLSCTPTAPKSPHIATKLSHRAPSSRILLLTCSRAAVTTIIRPSTPSTESSLMTSPKLSPPPVVNPAPNHPEPLSDSSSSDSFSVVPRNRRKMPVQLKFASVEQDTPSKAPMLFSGDITPKVMREFEDACFGYFENKEIAADKQVRKILAGLKDDRVKEWLSVDRDRVCNLTFAEFMVEFRASYLPKNWEQDACAEVLSLTQGNQTFWDFTISLQSKNTLLHRYYVFSTLPKDKLHHQMEANMEKAVSALRCTWPEI